MEDANGGEVGENESQHGGEEAKRKETKGMEEANLECKCWVHVQRRKKKAGRGRRKGFFKKIYYLLFLNEG